MFASQKSEISSRKYVGGNLIMGDILVCLAALLVAGCVERRLTIQTEPPGATVVLNDQQIGEAPVTVPFNWYGDYWVRISKQGYETLDTHRKLKAPLHDYFPFDFFAQILYPGRIVDAYEWTFELSPKVYPAREQLIDNAQTLRTEIEERNAAASVAGNSPGQSPP